MKQAIFFTNNAYDGIVLENGTWIHVTEQVFSNFLSTEGDFSNWNGENDWAEYASTMDEAAIAGGEVVAYFEDGVIVIGDQDSFSERKAFYFGHEED